MMIYTGFGRAVTGIPIWTGKALLLILLFTACCIVFMIASFIWMIGLFLVGLSGWVFSWYWNQNWLGMGKERPSSRALLDTSVWLARWEQTPKLAWKQLLKDLYILKDKKE